MAERVQKVLSQWGLASRRQAEAWIRQGRVQVNGAVAELGQRIDPGCDRITVDGKAVKPCDRPAALYILLNKPLGVVCTCHDPEGRRTVLDLLPQQLGQGQGLHPVGRLDVDSTGALLLTNDGELTYMLTHPRHQMAKTYRVWVEGHPAEKTLRQWQQGVRLDGRKTLPARVRVLRQTEQATQLEIVLREGRNRQIRRVAEQLGHPVLRLHRTAIGSIQLQSELATTLPPGNYRFLSESEIISLKTQIDLTSKRAAVRQEGNRP